MDSTTAHVIALAFMVSGGAVVVIVAVDHLDGGRRVTGGAGLALRQQRPAGAILAPRREQLDLVL